jgi:proline dehydrogenase
MPSRSAVNDVAEQAMRSTLLTLSHRKSLGRLATRVPITRPMVRRFISGESFDEALPAIARLRDAGMGTTVDVLGESVTAEADARAAAERYLALLGLIAANGIDRNVSLKPSQMGLAIDPALARENIGRIVAKAVEIGAFVRIDMEDHTTTDATLDLWRAAGRTARVPLTWASSSRPPCAGATTTSRRSSRPAGASACARAPTRSPPRSRTRRRPRSTRRTSG